MENSPRETQQHNQDSDPLDRFEQYYPGIFDNITTEQSTDRLETTPLEDVEDIDQTEDLTSDLVDSDNELNNPSESDSDKIDSKGERLKRISKRSLKLLGGVAIATTTPLLTELVQRNVVNKQMRIANQKDHKNMTIAQKAEKVSGIFKGSAEDFKKINREENKRREQERIDRRNRRKEFFS